MSDEFILAVYDVGGVIILEATNDKPISNAEAAYVREALLIKKDEDCVAVLKRRFS